MSLSPITGLPGTGNTYTATPVSVLRSMDRMSFAAGGVILSGNYSSDTSNTSNPEVLTNGLVLGKMTTAKTYRPAIIGIIGSAYTSGGTSLTVTAAVATEVARLITLAGTSVSLKAIGPPTAAGTVATTSVTCSAASGTTLTVSSLGVDKAAGTIIAPADGAQAPLGLHFNEWGTRMTDLGNSRVDQPLPRLLISGDVFSTAIPFYSTLDASVQTWLKAQLQANGRTFTFSDDY